MPRKVGSIHDSSTGKTYDVVDRESDFVSEFVEEACDFVAGFFEEPSDLAIYDDDD